MDGSYEATKRNTTISYFHGALHLQAVLDGADDSEETIKNEEIFSSALAVLTRMHKNRNVIAQCVINRFVRLSKENKEKYNFTLQRKKGKKGGANRPSPLLSS